MEVINNLLGYPNLKIVQHPEMFAFSLDSVLLPNFVELRKTDKNILDIGTGNAVMPLILTTKTSAKITAVEIQKDVYEMAKKSIALNNINDQIDIINKDINELYKNWESDSFDVIICNPPYFKYEASSNINTSEYKTIARHEIFLDIDRLLKVSKKLLKTNGTLALVHRPERLIDITMKMKENNIEPKRITFIYPKKGKDANILLIEGRKNGKPGLKVNDPLYSHNEDGSYSDEILKYFK